MTASEVLGTEITVTHYDFITLYRGRKVLKGVEAKKEEVTAKHIDQFCRSFAGERFTFEPLIGELVGVYLPNNGPSGEWVRGRVEECLHRVEGFEYKILLIDSGNYVKSKRKYLLQLNEPMKKAPPKSKRIGVHGVLPEASLNQNTRLFITDFFHRGLMYFKKKQTIGSVIFGDISIKQESNGDVVSLTSHLLANKMVRKVDNFEAEARKFYSGIEEMEEVKENSSSLSSTCPEKDSPRPPQPHTENEKKSECQHEKICRSKDTGYSSSDIDLPEDPFVRDDAVMVPAGYNYDIVKKDKKKKSSIQEIKPIKTYFQLKREKEKQLEKCAKSSTMSKVLTKSKTCPEESAVKKQHVNQGQIKSEEEIDNQDVFKPRKDCFSELRHQKKKDITVPESERKVRGSRAFDLNFKSKVKPSEKVMADVDIKQDIMGTQVNVGEEKNVQDQSNKRENLETTQSSINSLDRLKVSLSISSLKSLVADDSGLSNETEKNPPSLQNSTLSKKQRLSLKLKAGLAAREVVRSLTQESVEGRNAEDSVNSKAIRTHEVCGTSQSSTIYSHNLSSNLEFDNTNKIIGSTDRLEGDLNGSSTCSGSSQNLLTTEIESFSQEFKQLKQSDQLLNSEIKISDTNGHQESECSAEVNAKEKCQSFINLSHREKYDAQNANKPLDENCNPNKSLNYENNSLQEKRRRISEKLKKMKKEITESEDSQRDLSTSCESVCSEDSNSFHKHTHKPTLDSVMCLPIEELDDVDHDYTDISYNQTLLRCINTSAGVLYHSKDNKIVRPDVTLADCCLDGNIIQTLERMGRRDMNRIQKFAFPIILARRNVLMISSPRSGKTCGYIVPITSNLLSETFYNKLPSGNGPRALVITPGWKTGEFVASEFEKMSPFNTVIHSYGGGAEIELKMDLLQGCDVLVTTPRCVLRLLDYELTNFNRLCHVVMDDADELFGKFKPEMDKLIVAINNAEAKREQRGVDLELQVVLAARTWTPPLEELVTCILNNPIICITSQLEACVYAGIKPVAVFVQNDKKVEKLVGILREVEGKQRTVVMCRSKDDVKYVHRHLIEIGVRNVIAAHEDLSTVNILEVPGFWNKSLNSAYEVFNERPSLPILIRSDEVLEEIPITNASVLIHYNMSHSKKTFSLRFSCLSENYPNRLQKEKSSQKPQVTILLDEENDLEVPGVMEFMQRLGTVLPEPVLETLEKIKEMNDEKRLSEPLCEDLQEFGECWNVKDCPLRHIITADLDFPHNVPRTGWVKIIVQHVHDAGHYSVRLLEHAEKEDQWKRLPSNFLVLPMKLNNYYGTETNKRLHGHPTVGDMVAVETSTGVFQRASILNIVEHNKYNEAIRVYVRFVDNGRYDHVWVSRLLYLPEELAKPPPSVVDVYLCGLKPKDLDVTWPPAPGKWVDEQLRVLRRDRPNGYLMGKITLALKSSLWLEPVEYPEYLPTTDSTVFLLPTSLRKELLNTQNATENLGHIPTLRRLCEKAGIDLPPEEKVLKKPVQAQPQWAWLPQDRCESVHIIVVQDPDAIFLRINYLTECLQSLTEDIQKYASTQKKDNDCKKFLEPGDVCLGKPTGSEEWNRAIIKSMPAEDMVELFFADYGDIDVLPWSKVLPISNNLITKLPFQVIECYLAGIKFLPPASGTKDWEDEIIDVIYNLSRNENEEASSLMVKVCSVEAKGKYTSGKRYKVVLADPNVNPISYINSQLISSDFVQLLEEDKLSEDFEIPDTSNDNVETSECEGAVPSSSNSEVVPVEQNLDVALYNKQYVDEEFAMKENDEKVKQFLKDFEEGDFDSSIFRGIENDADISDNASEGSVSSLPRSRGSLPQVSAPRLQLPPPEAEDSLSCSSSTISSSHNSSTLSLNQERQNFESSKEQNINNLEYLQSSEPIAFSSPKIGRPLTPITSSMGHPNMSTPCKVTGIANKFKDLISPKFLGSSSHVSPPRSTNTDEDDLDNKEFQKTISDFNPNSNIAICESDEKNACQLTEEVGTYVKESSEEKKSPCLKWVESVIPDSDEDLTLIAENSVTNEQVIENPDLETRTPLVEWHQDDSFVFLHIKIPAITEYDFKSDITSVHFKAVYGGVPYEVSLPELFGGHKKEKARGTPKACYFEIVLEKLLKGKRKHWPRLTRKDEKFHWLKLNAEKSCEDIADSEDEDVKRLACSLPLWNENAADSESIASSDRSEVANSEISL